MDCLWAFTWVLSHHDELEPRLPCSEGLVRLLPDLKTTEPSVAFRERSRLRSTEELYEQTDLHYLLTWSARDAALAGDRFWMTQGSALFERRRALDWTIEDGPDWDEITLDT